MNTNKKNKRKKEKGKQQQQQQEEYEQGEEEEQQQQQQQQRCCCCSSSSPCSYSSRAPELDGTAYTGGRRSQQRQISQQQQKTNTTITTRTRARQKQQQQQQEHKTNKKQPRTRTTTATTTTTRARTTSTTTNNINKNNNHRSNGKTFWFLLLLLLFFFLPFSFLCLFLVFLVVVGFVGVVVAVNSTPSEANFLGPSWEVVFFCTARPRNFQNQNCRKWRSRAWIHHVEWLVENGSFLTPWNTPFGWVWSAGLDQKIMILFFVLCPKTPRIRTPWQRWFPRCYQIIWSNFGSKVRALWKKSWRYGAWSRGVLLTQQQQQQQH